MDSAGSDAVRNAVAQQGALLGQHASQITATTHDVEVMASQMADFTVQLRELRRDQDSIRAVAAASPSVHAHSSLTPEPRMPTPTPYDGDPMSCRSFLTQCSIIFALQPITYASEITKVAFVITLLTGKAREWGTTVWAAKSPYCASFELFEKEMLKVFDRSLAGKEAASQLARLRQGDYSVTDYSIRFRTLAALTGWNEEAC